MSVALIKCTSCYLSASDVLCALSLSHRCPLRQWITDKFEHKHMKRKYIRSHSLCMWLAHIIYFMRCRFHAHRFLRMKHNQWLLDTNRYVHTFISIVLLSRWCVFCAVFFSRSSFLCVLASRLFLSIRIFFYYLAASTAIRLPFWAYKCGVLDTQYSLKWG